MESISLIISFVVLLIGVFVVRKLWLGALLAMVTFVVFKVLFTADFSFIYAPIVTGFVISTELAFLLFGAFLFYNTIFSNHHFDRFIEVTSSFSSRLFILIMLGVFMLSFMEGIAGFGIPAMLIAPLLLTLGFKPLTSIVLPLAMNTTAVTFGALGTPLKVGLGIHAPDTTTAITVLLNSLPAISLPFLLAFLYSKTEQTQLELKQNAGMLFGAGLSFFIPFSLTSLISVEFPSVVGGFAGLLLFVSIFVPRKERPTFVFWLHTFYPYLLFVLLLLLARFFLSDYEWNVPQSTRSLSFYQPGLVFVLATVLYFVIVQKQKLVFHLYLQGKETFAKTGKSMVTILLLVCFAQLIHEDLSNSINQVYLSLHETTKLFVNPVLGVVGSFISGSATMSNLLLGNAIQSDELAGTSLPLFLALLHTGSAIGNAISLQNIIMVKSVVDQPLIGYAKIMKYNLAVVGLYMVIIVLLALIIRIFL